MRDMRTRSFRVGLPVVLAVMIVVLLSFALFRRGPSALPSASHRLHEPENAIYLWQRQWGASVGQAVERAAPAVDSFMVLGAEFVVADGELRCRLTGAEWSLFATAKRPVWVVLRAHELPVVDTPEGRGQAVGMLAGTARDIIGTARDAGAPVHGIQLDYDCPTEDLGHYAHLLEKLREELKGVPVSVTALPTWLGRPGFRSVLEGLDHFVLQVHSLARPADAGDPAILCDTTRVAGWVKDAASLQCPFYVALPAHGYRLVFDAGGELVEVGAEGLEEVHAGGITQEVRADPAAIAGVVRALRALPPSCRRGVAWFRLPVEGDRLNWRWTVLEQVMAGRAPRVELVAEVRRPSEGLYEVWVVNGGEYRPTEPIRVRVDWTGGTVAAHDALGGFRYAGGPGNVGGHLLGTAPDAGEEGMAAWFRFTRADTGQDVVFTANVETVR